MEHVSPTTANLEVLTPAGDPVRLGSLWARRPVLLVLVRHYGCVFCRQQVRELRHILGDIERAGVDVAVIGNGTPLMAEAFVEESGLEAPLYTNPGREVYEALGAKRPTLLAAALDPKLLWNSLKLAIRGQFNHGTKGDRAQLGGVFLVMPDGSMPFAYRSERGGDHPSNDLVLRVVRQAVPVR